MKRSVRHSLVRLHRWAGMVLGLLFVLMGLSGALLVFEGEVDGALNPQWSPGAASCSAAQATSAASVEVVDLQVAVAAVQARWPGARISFAALPETAGGAYRITFKAPAVADNEALVVL